jgi:hypothetical protein
VHLRTPNHGLIVSKEFLKEQATSLGLPQHEVHEDLHLECQSIISISRIKQESLGDAVELEDPPFPIIVLFVDAGKMSAGIVPLIQPQAWAYASSQQSDPFASQCCVLWKENLYRFQSKGGVLNVSLTNKHPVSIFIYTGHGTSSGGGRIPLRH